MLARWIKIPLLSASLVMLTPLAQAQPISVVSGHAANGLMAVLADEPTPAPAAGVALMLGTLVCNGRRRPNR